MFIRKSNQILSVFIFKYNRSITNNNFFSFCSKKINPVLYNFDFLASEIFELE